MDKAAFGNKKFGIKNKLVTKKLDKARFGNKKLEKRQNLELKSLG